ncbi:hypothetical protein [Caballeronia arationis]|uniref:hypothetical protein n=1 Tax=Caballeronia arationis TaxID=1777142 RepID=UPI0011804810|nr:hypothetical protein [Caballeronia arationis]
MSVPIGCSTVCLRNRWKAPPFHGANPPQPFDPTFATVRCENIKPTLASPLPCIAGFRAQARSMLSSPTQLQASTAILTIADEGIDY